MTNFAGFMYVYFRRFSRQAVFALPHEFNVTRIAPRPACPEEDRETDCSDPNVLKYRTISGRCNNLLRPVNGKHTIPFRRHLLPEYDDGFSTPKVRGRKSGNVLPNPRLVSRIVHRDQERPDNR